MATVALLLSCPPGLSAAPASAPAADGLSKLLTDFGVRPLSPSPATDFTLPALGGGERSLSDFGGSWILLTFWATWCGPCRMEMPSLETLHRQRRQAGLVVLGVSIDDRQGKIRPFVEELGLTFPMLWDEGGSAGISYRASSIPLTYVVDPAGRVVGISRGARDWTAMTPLVDALLTEFPGGESTEAEFASAGPVPLPEVLDPPTAEVRLADASPRVGETFHLDVRLRWRGDFREYLPQPPRIELPEGLEREGVTATTDSREGANLVTYRLALKATEPGRYALDPVELRYSPSFESTVMTERAEGPEVEVIPSGPGALSLTLVVAATAAALLVSTLGWRRYRSAGRPERGESEAERFARLEARFQAARERRISGDAAGFVAAMSELEEELFAGGADGRDRLAEEVRYGGQMPPPAELDRWQRRVELALEEGRPDAEREGTRRLRLKKT